MTNLDELERLEKSATLVAEWDREFDGGTTEVAAKYIANALPALIAELRTLRQENDELKGANS